MDVDEYEWYKVYLSVRRNVQINIMGNQKTSIEEEDNTVVPNRDIISTTLIHFIPSPFFSRFSSVEY